MPIIVSVCICVRLYVCQCVRVCTKNTPIEMRFVSHPLEVPLLWLIKVGNHPITPNYLAITQPIRAKLAQGAGGYVKVSWSPVSANTFTGFSEKLQPRNPIQNT